MFGDNPIRPPVAGDGQMLDVQHIFATIQGEGPLAGTPAIFIRLGGCNLACDFCDTEFESFTSLGLEEIFGKLKSLGGAADSEGRNLQECLSEAQYDGKKSGAQVGIHLVVITGGEPLRQNIAPLCDALLAQGFQVQIETNGTLWRPLDARVQVVCSPKASGGRYFRLRDDVLMRTNAIKFIVSAFRPEYQAIAEVGQEQYGIPVYIQPMDEQDEARNRANQQYAVRLAMQTGCKLSLQLHKILGME